MDIMLTVSYCINIPRDEFFETESGEVNEEIMERLETLFPKEVINDMIIKRKIYEQHFQKQKYYSYKVTDIKSKKGGFVM